jgi:c-di-GMP-binding flagellar brake protein YcgR
VKIFKKKKMSDKEFIKVSQKIIKGLNDLTITNPEYAVKFNAVTDMLERKIKETESK